MKNDVRELRLAAGLSQRELAEALDVSRQTVNSIETGRYDPSLPLAMTGDARDDAVLTCALAVLGLAAFPLTAAAVIAIGLGTYVPMVLTLLLQAEVLVGAAAFVVINRRS